MASYYADGDKIAVRLFCKAAEQVSVNVLHYRVESQTGNGAFPSQVADAMANKVSDEMKALLSAEALYAGLSVQRIAPGVPDVQTYSTIGAGAGLVVGDLLPRQTCGIITKRTVFAGRAYRGRVYLPFPSEASNDTDSTPTAVYLGDLDLLAAELVDPVTAGAGGDTTSIVPVLKNKLPHAEWPRLVVCVARDKWATQRRRGSYGQANVSPI